MSEICSSLQIPPPTFQIPSPALQILPGGRGINCKTTLPWLGIGVFGLNTPRPPPPCLGVFKPNTPLPRLRRGGFTLESTDLLAVFYPF